MKIKLSLNQPDVVNSEKHMVQTELDGDSWTASTKRLAATGGLKTAEFGNQAIVGHLADIDPVLVDDFRRTL